MIKLTIKLGDDKEVDLNWPEAMTTFPRFLTTDGLYYEQRMSFKLKYSDTGVVYFDELESRPFMILCIPTLDEVINTCPAEHEEL